MKRAAPIICWPIWLLSMIVSAGAQEPIAAEEEFFARRIAPLLAEKCLACHGQSPEEVKGGLNLTVANPRDLQGDSGQRLITPGLPDESPLYLAVTRQHDVWSPMPPKEADRLSPEQMDWIAQWIATGAIWPDQDRLNVIRQARQAKWAAEDGVVLSTGGGQSDAWSNRRYASDALWAYMPVYKPLVPGTGARAIDNLLAQRTPPGVPVAQPATAREFIRRATLDLTGLLPEPTEVVEFVQQYEQDSDQAVQRLIDRLLASPHYGERMAQHWLDVVRYADSSGLANDYERGNAWRYRDYIVRSFNQDKPYDQFIIEQLAGDEMDEHNPELLVATGFLRMGPWELTGMEVPRIARQRFLDDVTNSVGEAFLAHSLQCARCHDHKFDPISTRDYYSLQAVFATTQLAERPAAFLREENTSGFDEARYLELTRAEHQGTLERLDEKSLTAAENWFVDRGLDPSQWRAAVEEAKAIVPRRRRGVFGAARNALLREKVPEDQFPPRMLGWSPEEIGMERIANKGLERLTWQLERYEPFALSVINGPTPSLTSVNAPLRPPKTPISPQQTPDRCTILIGGDPFAHGPPVRPGVLTALDAVRSATSRSVDHGSNHATHPVPETWTGRRLGLARWIARADNALTTRAIVNRIWMWHFDRAIAGNPNNFGSTGKRPTHPELLDWLAATFVEQGWSIKSMHRHIMTSDAYRRSARWEGEMAADERAGREFRQQMIDSYALFAPRRLSAEEIRDTMLCTTGQLNRTLGGIPSRPEINLEAALQPRQVMGTFAEAWVPNPLPAQRHRRSLYTLKLRGLVDPALEVFNYPPADFSCERRDLSTVTPQAFAMLNSRSSHERALALAARVVDGAAPGTTVIQRIFERLFSRPASPAEVDLCLEHWQRMTAAEGERVIPPIVPALTIRRDAVEENTGQRFSYVETLYANRDYVPDLQPADCDASIRGLAHVCLVLFNSNEFLYVY